MRRRDLEVTEMSEILNILDECKVVHVGLVDDGVPYIIPMNYGYEMIDGKLVIYLHCGMNGYKLDVMRKNPICCFEMECNVEPFEGQVACQYGMVYESIMGKGTIEILDDAKEKMAAMTVLMKTQTGKHFDFNEKLVSIINVMKITADSYSAKRRPLPPALQAAKDTASAQE